MADPEQIKQRSKELDDMLQRRAAHRTGTMTDVERAIDTIKKLYGISTEAGDKLLLSVVYDLGLAALTDDAILELARRHEDEERRQISKALSA